MPSFLKKSLLTAVFSSAALLAGCGHQDRPKADPARHFYTPVELMTKATAAADAQGLAIRLQSGDGCNAVTKETADRGYEDGCSLHVEKKADDGFIRAAYYRLPSNSITPGQCAFRDNDSVAAANAHAADTAFAADAAAKFRKMKFTVLDTFKDPESSLDGTADGCYQTTSADFLLKSGVTGKLYSATFSEGYDFDAKAGYGAEVSDLAPVDRLAKAQTDEDAADEDTPAVTSSSSATSSSSTATPKQESKLCVGVCSGPHIDLKTGKLQVFGTGPGLKLR